MFTLAFWKAAAERAVKTAAQAAIVQLVVGDGFNAFDADWGTAMGFAIGGAVASLLFSLISIGVGGPGPSLGAETLRPAVAAEVEPASPTGLVAGPAADVPEGDPVDVEPLPAGDYIAQDFVGGTTTPPTTTQPDKGGYWGGV